MLCQMIYTSQCQVPGPRNEVAFVIKSIADESRRNNASVDVTGALMMHNGTFAQVLEGPPDAVNRVFEHIARDRRHSDIAVHANGHTESRTFPLWSMALAGAGTANPIRITPAIHDSEFDLSCITGAEILDLLVRLARATQGV
jgi:hypothetical protein